MNFFFYFIYRVEQTVFKSKFSGWDDVLAVDFTKTAKNVAQFRKVFMLLQRC